MRIISGSSKGRRLTTRKSDAIRPTSDRVKESMFGILGDRVKGRTALDLFAGTGNLGIEALSRGARRAVFVEMGRQAVPVIRRNLALCGMWDRSEIVPKDVIRAIGILKERGECFDLILVDPPYGKGMVQRTLLKLSLNPIYHRDSILVIQHDRREPLSSSAGGWNLMRQKRIGDTLLSFLGPVSEPAEVRPEASPPGDPTPEEDNEPQE